MKTEKTSIAVKDTANQVATTTLASTAFAHGISVDEIVTLVPIQVIGRLPSGERYYFRSRHGTASLDVWDTELEFEGPAPPHHADLIWSDEIEEWSDSETSDLAERDTADLILTFAVRFASRSTES